MLIIKGNDVEIATEAFGDSAHPPVVLIMGGNGIYAMVA